jgi:NAD(P)-dependent dehydrogenase (short-subunit alcohol dehydrogenase family)
LVGKTAFVTGAGCDVGRAVARRLAIAGARVIISARRVKNTSIRPDLLAETAAMIESAGGTVIQLRGDLENPREAESLVARAVEAAGPFQILVHVAGLSRFRAVESNRLHGYGLTVEHYFRVPLVLTEAAKAVMRDCGGGSIVNVGAPAICGFDTSSDPLREIRDLAVICAERLALLRLTQAMAAELENDNIGAYLALPSMRMQFLDGHSLSDAELPPDPIEALAETVIALCSTPVELRSGAVAYATRMH